MLCRALLSLLVLATTNLVALASDSRVAQTFEEDTISSISDIATDSETTTSTENPRLVANVVLMSPSIDLRTNDTDRIPADKVDNGAATSASSSVSSVLMNTDHSLGSSATSLRDWLNSQLQMQQQKLQGRLPASQTTISTTEKPTQRIAVKHMKKKQPLLVVNEKKRLVEVPGDKNENVFYYEENDNFDVDDEEEQVKAKKKFTPQRHRRVQANVYNEASNHPKMHQQRQQDDYDEDYNADYADYADDYKDSDDFNAYDEWLVPKKKQQKPNLFAKLPVDLLQHIHRLTNHQLTGQQSSIQKPKQKRRPAVSLVPVIINFPQRKATNKPNLIQSLGQKFQPIFEVHQNMNNHLPVAVPLPETLDVQPQSMTWKKQPFKYLPMPWDKLSHVVGNTQSIENIQSKPIILSIPQSVISQIQNTKKKKNNSNKVKHPQEAPQNINHKKYSLINFLNTKKQTADPQRHPLSDFLESLLPSMMKKKQKPLESSKPLPMAIRTRNKNALKKNKESRVIVSSGIQLSDDTNLSDANSNENSYILVGEDEEEGIERSNGAFFKTPLDFFNTKRFVLGKNGRSLEHQTEQSHVEEEIHHSKTTIEVQEKNAPSSQKSDLIGTEIMVST